MAMSAVEASVHRIPEIFAQRIPLSEVVPLSEITDRLELTRLGVPVEGVRHPLLTSIRSGRWFSIEAGRIYIEIRHPAAFMTSPRHELKVIKGVDFDDCLASATRWHRREYELMEQKFSVPVDVGRSLYEKSKVMVPGKAEGERRYTPRLNMALLTAYLDLIERKAPPDKAFEEVTKWSETIAGLVQSYGEIAVTRQLVDPRILEVFTSNHITDFLYHDFAGAVFNTGRPSVLGFIATRGKIEGPLGQVDKVHSSGVLRRGVDMVVYTNDIKAETLLYLSKLLPGDVKGKAFYLFDDNVAEIVPYLETARVQGLENVWAVQVCHPDAKRKDSAIDLEPARIVGRSQAGETVLKYYTTRNNLPLSHAAIFWG